VIDTIKNPVVKEVLDWVLHITVAVLLALLIVKFVGQRTLVSGNSMQPTLQDKNQLIVEKITPRFRALKRGDIVAVYIPEVDLNYIKRVIGLEGDLVEVKDGKVFVNNVEIKEAYINGNVTLPENPKYTKVIVPKGEVYVMGDNRLPNMSNDSRNIGPLEIKRVEGRAIFRYWPLNEMGLLNK
jgi:signal peptidase I